MDFLCQILLVKLTNRSVECGLPGVAEIAAFMIVGAERRIDIAASNVSNMNTPGYRTRRTFSATLDARGQIPQLQVSMTKPNMNNVLKYTGNPLDFAASTAAVMAFRTGAGLIYSRSAQIHRDTDGRLVDQQGSALLGIDGNDIVVSSPSPSVLADGTVLVNGQPQGRIGLFGMNPTPGALMGKGLPELAESATVKQGMLVDSDVALSDEMAELNKATRQAETGAKLFQLQDDLLARAASQLGSIGK